MKYNKGFVGIGMIIAIIAVLVVGGGAFYYATQTQTPASNTEENNYQSPVNQNSTIPTNTQTQNNNLPPAPARTPLITVLSPNGGEVFNREETIKINWQNGSSSMQVYVTDVLIQPPYAGKSAGLPPKAVVTEATNQSQVQWKIPATFAPGQYVVRIMCNFGCSDTGGESIDYSDTYFTIKALGGSVLTQAQAKTLVHQTWSNCSQGDCSGVTVTVTQNSNNQYVVTAIFTELDDSTSQTKRVSIATYQNGTWTLGQPTVTRMCHRGNADGTTGWTAGLCM